MLVRFGPFSLDATRRQLFRGRAAIHLTPKAFDLLHLLVSEAPRVVHKHELHERLWPGTFVSDSSLTGLVKEIRRALEDNDPDVPVIRTVHRVGYACALAVEAPERRDRAWHWLVFRGRRVVLHEGENLVGRDPDSDVWLEVPGISRRHARILVDAASVQIEDLGSKNGTTVGNVHAQTAVRLRDGDRITFGTVVSVYRSSSAGLSTETRSRSAARDDTAPTNAPRRVRAGPSTA
jgi:DNA-binding winged helix-turn-helix (wHTH) protein